MLPLGLVGPRHRQGPLEPEGMPQCRHPGRQADAQGDVAIGSLKSAPIHRPGNNCQVQNIWHELYTHAAGMNAPQALSVWQRWPRSAGMTRLVLAWAGHQKGAVLQPAQSRSQKPGAMLDTAPGLVGTVGKL